MINLTSASLCLGQKQLFTDATFRIYERDKVALIGPNGAGKSTLFQLLLGQLQLDEGEISVPAHWEVAHMAQSIDNIDQTALNYVLSGDAELVHLEKELELAKEKDDGHHTATLLAQYEAIDGYSANARANQLLFGLGFSNEQLSKPISAFSGGWRGRLGLARALMCRSDLLLLDEPTNHLDVETVDWLATTLRAYTGTLILISHDREFIDALANQVISLENSTLQTYRGNYSAYERQRAEYLSQQQVLLKKQEQQRSDMERFVERFRYKASKAKQAQSRLKALERMEKITPAHIDSPFSFEIVAREKISTPLIHLTQAVLGYNTTSILSNVELSIAPGQRIGLLGANGQGKSTLIKSLIGELPLLSGERTEGKYTHFGYFAQQQLEILDLDASCFDTIQKIAPKSREQEIRNFLGGFNFSGDVIFTPIRSFSGGEKARLALALIVWQKPNLLILDEPTNHLDLEVRHALMLAMQNFEGAILLVSHDQYLLNHSVDEFYLVNNGECNFYDGDLNSYLSWLRSIRSNQKVKKTTTNLNKRQLRQDAAAKRAKTTAITKRLKQIEQLLATHESKLKTLESSLANPDSHTRTESTQTDYIAHGTLQKEIAELELEWLKLNEQLEN